MTAAGLIIPISVQSAGSIDRDLSRETDLDLAASDFPSTNHQEGAEVIRFEHITTADGLSFPFIRSIVQDQYGFLWFGTDQGLNKFDGHEFTVYRSVQGDPDSLHFSYITDLLVDQEGGFWVAGAGGVDFFDRQAETFTFIDERGGQADVVYEDSQGLVWISFWHGLYAYDRDTHQLVYELKSYATEYDGVEVVSLNSANALFEDSQGDLWIGTSQGLDRFNRQTGLIDHFEPDPTDASSLSEGVVTVILEDRKGSIWVGTLDGGLNRFDRTSGTFIHYRFSPNDPHSISNDFVTSLLEDNQGILWVGTINGLDQYDPVHDHFTHYHHDPSDMHSLSDNTVISLFEDRSGVLWVGTTNGISKSNRRGDIFSLYQSRPELVPSSPEVSSKEILFGMSVDKISTTLEDQDGILWIGTYFGGLNRVNFETGEVKIFKHDPADPSSLKSDIVTAIFEDASGRLWLGNSDGWLEQFDPRNGGFIHFRKLPSNISVITEDLMGNLWVGTFNGLYRFEPENREMVFYPHYWQDYDHWNRFGSLSHNIILDIFIDQYGVPWVGTFSGGINIWDAKQDKFTHLRHNPSDPNTLSHDQVLSILEDPQNRDILWIGTGGGGLNRYDRTKRTFTHYTTGDGLIDDVVGCILVDDTGSLWLTTPKGLSRFTPDSENFNNFDLSDGVGALNSGAFLHEPCHRSMTGEMYFDSLHGIYVMDPNRILENLSPPPIMITGLRIFNKPVRSELFPDEQIVVPNRENYLSFEFAALDYILPEKNQYAYMMEGLDEDWVYAGNRRYVDYAGLGPGNYVFRVKGSNSDGIWNEAGVAVYLTIEAPIWDTWVFRILAGIAFVLFGVGIYRQRVKVIQERSRELEAQVEDRTQEIETRRRELEILYQADQELYRHLDLDQLLQVLVDTAVQTLKADQGLLMFWDESLGTLVTRAVHGPSPWMKDEIALGFKKELAQSVASSGIPLAVENILTDPRIEKDKAIPTEILAFMLVPIQVSDVVFGVFSVDFTRPHTFDQDERRLLLSLAQRAGLAIQNARLFSQVQELAAIEERQRLARDLHDAVSQMLFSASLIAEALPSVWQTDQEQAQVLLEKLRQSNRGALAEMRGLLMELRPGALAEASLQDLLTQLAQAASGREGIPVDLHIDEICQLPVDGKIALYRIAQEALNNVVKHAQASSASLSLRCTKFASSPPNEEECEYIIELSIRDDGEGFDVQEVSQEHHGLNIMLERANVIGADLDISSEPGDGTSVRVIWQVPRGSDEDE